MSDKETKDKDKRSSTFSRLANFVPTSLSSSSASPQSQSQSHHYPPSPVHSRDGHSRDRDRDRDRDSLPPNSPMFPLAGIYDSPTNTANHYNRLRQPQHQPWANETLPPNVSSNYTGGNGSSFSFAPASSTAAYSDISSSSGHFWPGGFSFEGDQQNQGHHHSGGIAGQQHHYHSGLGGAAYMDRTSNKFYPTTSTPDSSPVALGEMHWSNGSQIHPGGGVVAHPSAGLGGIAGGGRFRSPTRISRSLKFALSGGAAGERGLVALAKPRENGEGRVAVVGKSFLKVLKVPDVSSSQNEQPQSSTSVTSNSSIASRRSISRGSPVPVSSEHGSNNIIGHGSSPRSRSRGSGEDIVELYDVRGGSRLSPNYLFSDVKWGYGETANKLGTSFSNGAIAIWDLNREGPNRLETPPKHQHDRAINQVTFGGPSGNYLISAGQDGQVKLWDIRQDRPSTNKVKASSPVQRVQFSPSPSQTWMLLATCTSGTLIRYDLRNLSGGKSTTAMLDRIAGHVGPCLAMDWRDNFPSDGADRREGGWVVTSGVDRTIKIWDFSLPILSTRPVRTLFPGQPVQDVVWHPSKGFELACCPMPTLGVAARGADEAGSSSISIEGGKTNGTAGSLWRKNEVEIWDTRRPNHPRVAIRTEDSVSAILYNDDQTLWGTSKTSAVFNQYDVEADSYSLLDNLPPANATWNIDGELLFAGSARSSQAHSWKKHSENQAVDAPVFIPDTFFNSVTNFDPDFQADTFSYLANALVLGGKPFREMCEINAEACDYVGKMDAKQLWNTLKIWFDDERHSLPDSPPPTPPAVESIPLEVPSAAQYLNDWLLSPTTILEALPPTVPPSTGRRSFGAASISRSRTLISSPLIAPTDPPIAPSDVFAEQSSRPPPQPQESDQTSSDSERDHPARKRAISAAHQSRARSQTVGAFTPILSLDNPLDSFPPNDNFGLPPPARDSSLSRIRARRKSSSESSDDDAGDVHARATKILGRSITALPKTRRASSSVSANNELRPRSFGFNKTSRQPSPDRNLSTTTPNMSRRGSNALSTTGEGVLRAHFTAISGPTAADKAHTTATKCLEEATELIVAEIRETLQEYADRGDSQLCASACCVLQDKNLGLAPLFVARVTKAYLELLRRSKHYVPAAGLIKFSPTESIRALSENTVVFHTACGRCGKALDQPPFGLCSRCSAQGTRCCICNLVVRTLYVFCAACGHGAHIQCLDSYSAAVATGVWDGGSFQDTSHPSTPGIVTPGARAWLWGETEELDSIKQIHNNSLQCPVGACSHSPCLLTSSEE